MERRKREAKEIREALNRILSKKINMVNHLNESFCREEFSEELTYS